MKEHSDHLLDVIDRLTRERDQLRAEQDALREALEYIRADPRLPFRLKRIADDALPSPRDVRASVPDKEQA